MSPIENQKSLIYFPLDLQPLLFDEETKYCDIHGFAVQWICIITQTLWSAEWELPKNIFDRKVSKVNFGGSKDADRIRKKDVCVVYTYHGRSDIDIDNNTSNFDMEYGYRMWIGKRTDAVTTMIIASLTSREDLVGNMFFNLLTKI